MVEWRWSHFVGDGEGSPGLQAFYMILMECNSYVDIVPYVHSSDADCTTADVHLHVDRAAMASTVVRVRVGVEGFVLQGAV